ncbi:MAG: F0F1-type ATP synthase assembly protein I [Phycisphaerales bacterium]|jgi:F0F1-type ATP synthase assembly protein I
MDEHPNNDLADQAKAWVIALNVVYGMLGFGAMGFAIDYFAGTKPKWMLILGGIGLFVGLYRFIREALAMNKAFSKPRRKGPEGENRR